MKKENKKLTPDRSKDFGADKNAVPYYLGNRKSRREIAFSGKIKDTGDFPSRKFKLTKEYWEKGKSKFVEVRLKQMFGNLFRSKNINDIK